MSDRIHIGNMDRRITIVKYSDAQTLTGAPVHAEEEVKTTWAQVQFLSNYGSGGEEIDNQVISLNIRRYVMRFFPEMLDNGESFYIKDLQDNGEYNIKHIEEVGRREFLVCKAERRQ